jgi:type I restriction enzyme S subunit
VAQVKSGRLRQPCSDPHRLSTPYVRAANITDNGLDLNDLCTMEFSPSEQAAFLLQRGDVLLAEASGSPALVGRTAIWNGEAPGACFQNSVIRVRPTTIDSRFLYYQCLHLHAEGRFARMATGVGINHLGAGKVAALSVVMPPPQEQQRVVAALDGRLATLTTACESMERAERNLVHYRATVLAAACSGKLVPTEADLARRAGRSYEPADQLLARTSPTHRGHLNPRPPAGPLPEGWTWATMAELSPQVCVGHAAAIRDAYTECGIPFLRSQNVRPGRFDPEGLLPVTAGFHQSHPRSMLTPGDLVVVRTGAIGTTCVIPPSLPAANCADLIIIKQPSGLMPEYAAHYLNGVGCRRLRRGTSGVSMAHLKAATVANLSIPVPPWAEQERIVAEIGRHLSRADALTTAIAQAKRRTQRLRRAILAAAFQGHLTG